MSGIYDMYIDDQSRICIDKNDSDTRSEQTDEKTIDVICEGRMDKGDTLSSAPAYTSAGPQYHNFPIFDWSGSGYGGFNGTYWRSFLRNLTQNFTLNSETGISHEKQTNFEFPIKARAIFHAGRSHQRSDDMLTRIGTEKSGNEVVGGFKLQQDFEDKQSYWDSSFRLLDTAYLAVEYEIAEGDITIPQIDFVVRGREIQQYNYDYSYREMDNPQLYGGATSEAQRAKFKIGDFVDFYDYLDTNSALAADVQIVDLYKYVDAREQTHWKYRFSSNPLLKSNGTISTTTSFFMTVANYSGGSIASNTDRFHFATWDHKALSGDVGPTLKSRVTPTDNDGNATIGANSGGNGVDITDLPTTFQTALNYLAADGGITIGFSNSIVTLTMEDLLARIHSFQLDATNVNNGAIEDIGDGTTNATDATDGPQYVFTTNAVTLDSNDAEGGIDDYYKGQIIKITRKNIDGTVKVQTRRIIGYDASEKRVYVGDISPVETTNTQIGSNVTYKVKTTNFNSNIVVLQDGTNMSALAEGDVLQYNAGVNFPPGTSITNITGTQITLSNPGYVAMLTDLTFYRGADDTATTVEPQPWDFIPFDDTDAPTGNADTFEILPEGDKKVSINPAIQLLDYLINERFGRNLDINNDIDLDMFKQTARLCDTRSDVTLTLADGTYTVGQKWQLVTTHSSTDYFQWQGTVKTVESITYAGTAYKQVTFEDCIGKLIHKWFDWKSYEVGQVVYHRVSDINKIYLVSTAGTIAEPTGSNTPYPTADFELQLSTNSSTTADIHLASPTDTTLNEVESSWDRNPVIKKYNTTEGTFSINGYALYDSDDVKYWRYLGWQSQDQREVTRHQTNTALRTETPLFENVNSFLGHFNGILRYSNGKYQLDVESSAPTINQVTINGTAYTDPRIITADDIIGAINVDDAGLKGSANSVSVSIPDPQIRFDDRSVTFYKSEYLKEDRGIPKKKSVKTPFISNYFNARINAEQYLDQSRFSRKINFQMGPKGLLLLAGTLIKITYPRFNWSEKLFRISNLQIKEDCLVQVTALEHDDDSYFVEGKDKDILGLPPETGSGKAGSQVIPPGAPTNLTATTNMQAKIKLSWVNNINFGNTSSTGAGSPDWSTEIWYNNNAAFTGGDTASKLVGGLSTETYEHNLPDISEDTSYYYWVRHVKNIAKPRTTIASVFQPLNSAQGVLGTAKAAGAGSGIVYLYKSSIAEPTDDPSDDSLFPTVTVALTGDDAGKITGVASSQGSAAITTNQVIDTNGAATGWFTVPQDPTNNDHVIWIIAATASSTGNADEILRAEWTEPVKFSGAKGLNAATVELFQLNNSESTAPNDPSGDLEYTFSSGKIYLPGTTTASGGDFNNWLPDAGTPDASNKSLWKITAAAISNTDTTTVEAGDWSDAIRTARHATDGDDGNPGSNGTNGVNGINGVALTLTASPVLFTFDGTYYDPGSTSTLTLAASGGTITGVNWSTSAGTLVNNGAGTATSNTLAFAADRTEAQVKASATVTAVVTGTNSAGTTGQSFGTLTAVPATTLQGLPGGAGFFFIKRDDDTINQGLGQPTNSEIATPEEGNIAIVENSYTTPQQAAWKYTSNAWAQVDDFFRAEVIAADAIGAKQLAVSNDDDGTAGIYMNSATSGQYNIKIYDGDNNLRVKLGYIG